MTSVTTANGYSPIIYFFSPMTYGWILSFGAYCVIVGYHILSVRADVLDTLNTESACLQCAEAVFDSVALSVSHSNRQPNNPLAV